MQPNLGVNRQDYPDLRGSGNLKSSVINFFYSQEMLQKQVLYYREGSKDSREKNFVIPLERGLEKPLPIPTLGQKNLHRVDLTVES